MVKTTKTEKTPLLTTHKATTPAPSITRGVMLVTPALAAEWLKSNTHNRRLDPRCVATLAKAITAGQWRITHQGVAFGADGTLYDGQHRLHAIVQSDTAVSMEVTRGLSSADLDVIDNGGKGARRANEVLFITDGVRIGRNQTGVLNAAAQMLAGESLTTTAKLTPQQLRSALAMHGAAMDAIHGALMGCHMAGISAAPVAASLVIAWKTAPDVAAEFASMLRTGESLGPMHPALLLRNFLIARSGRGALAGVARDDVSLRTFSALDSFARGAEVKFVKASVSARDRYVAAWKRADG